MERKYLEVELLSAVLMEVVLFLVPLSQVHEEQHHHFTYIPHILEISMSPPPPATPAGGVLPSPAAPGAPLPPVPPEL